MVFGTSMTVGRVGIALTGVSAFGVTVDADAVSTVACGVKYVGTAPDIASGGGDGGNA